MKENIVLGENCTASCPTRNHATWGECVRGKGLNIGYCRSAAGWDATRQKQWDSDLNAYASARSEGIQPAGTNRRQVEDAKILSDVSGKAYQA